jgi:outer membrane protein
LLSFGQQRLTLNEAVNTAINNNNSLASLENIIQIQRYNIRNAEGDLFPSLNLSGNWTRNNSVTGGGVQFVNGVPIESGPTSRNTSTFSLTLNSNYTIFNGLANYQQVDVEEESQVALEYDLLRQKNDVVIQVNRNFFEVLKNEQVVIANEDNLEDSRRQLEMVREFFNVGRRTIADIYRQDVQVAQNELAVEQSRNNLRKAKVDLLTSMNENLNRDFTAEGAGVNSNITAAELRTMLVQYQNPDALVGRAINNRYDYKSTLQEIRVNRLRLEVAEKVLYYPTISAFGSYNVNGDALNRITDNRVAQYGISLNYPIFQGFNLDVNRQIAEVNIRQKSIELQQLELQIRSDIRKSVIDLETAYKQVEILDRSIVSAQQDVVLSEENYRVGLGTLLDVQTARTRLNGLVIDRITAVYNFYIAQRQLQYYTGELRF